jgi:hypothetical protein
MFRFLFRRFPQTGEVFFSTISRSPPVSRVRKVRDSVEETKDFFFTSTMTASFTVMKVHGRSCPIACALGDRFCIRQCHSPIQLPEFPSAELFGWIHSGQRSASLQSHPPVSSPPTAAFSNCLCWKRLADHGLNGRDRWTIVDAEKGEGRVYAKIDVGSSSKSSSKLGLFCNASPNCS